MQIVQLTPGSGDNFYCENCLRDNLSVPALRRLGHDVCVVPLYLPPGATHRAIDAGTPVFFGGINVWLQQKLRLFRHTPRWLDRVLDARWLLRLAGRHSGMTDSRELGETLLSMLAGVEGRQRKELVRLIDYLTENGRPDLVVLSSVLLAGLAPEIRRRLGVPVACLLQGEAEFIDGVPPDLAERCWAALRRAAAAIDGFVSVSAWYRDRMAPQLGVDPATVAVVPVGLDPAGYSPAPVPPDPPVLGFLSRLCADRGLDLVVDAFLALRRQPAGARARLLLAGGRLPVDDALIAAQRTRLAQAGLAGDCEIIAGIDDRQRQDFLRRVSVLSVPERKPEGSGLFLLEAAASGVPVVQPDIGPYREILARTGGGLLYRAGDPVDFAERVAGLLGDPERARALGATARASVLARCTDEVMAHGLAVAYTDIAARRA